MDNVKEDVPVANKTQIKKIGGTTYTITSHYSGNETYEDVVKSVLRREIEKE